MDLYIAIEPGHQPKFVVQHERVPDTMDAEDIISDYFFYHRPDDSFFKMFFEEIDFSSTTIDTRNIDEINIEIVDV